MRGKAGKLSAGIDGTNFVAHLGGSEKHMANPTANMSVMVLGCPITNMGLDDFVNSAEQFITSKTPHYIAMMNVAKLVKMRADRDLAESILQADLIGADGVPLVWVSRLFGTPLPGRVNGTDLMYRLLERASEKGYRVFFFGATEAVLERVLEVVQQEYPGVKIAGSQHGYFTPAEEPDVVDKIRIAKPDILLIAFGTPKKELWVKRYLSAMGVPVIHGVGGSFDVMAGVVRRAPLWMQRSGLEWFFRMWQEPSRMWRRYLVTNTLFALLVLKEWLCLPFTVAEPKAKRH
jgi:N-acetylglucosaminyldiphosphoundecaprenol N-acetyl-beta-D-mannosaminyltransferase